MTNAKFYSLDSTKKIFGIEQAKAEIVYGESFTDGLQLSCDKGDFLIVENDKITKNIGKNIAQWCKESFNYCIPTDQNANDFLEFYSPGSSYYPFVSNNTEQIVYARYVFDNQWEVIFPLSDEEENENQILDSDLFMKNLTPADDVSKEYLSLVSLLFYKSDDTNEEWVIEERYPCECHCHEMSVFADNSEPNIEFAYWQRGGGEEPWSWSTRFKTILTILTKGKAYSDMVILSQESARKLKNTLELFLEKNNANK